jgi:hypothetical protein
VLTIVRLTPPTQMPMHATGKCVCDMAKTQTRDHLGWCTLHLRLSSLQPGRADLASGRRRALLRRQQKWHGHRRDETRRDETILLLNKKLAEDFDYRRKQAGLLQNDVCRQQTNHANSWARVLAERVEDIPGLSLMFALPANGVFLQLSEPTIEALRARARLALLHAYWQRWRTLHRLLG